MSTRVLSRAAAIAAALCLLTSASLASAEVTQEGNLRVSFIGKIAPHALPRKGRAPVKVTLGGDIVTTDGTNPPQLRTISLAINRNGRIDYRGLPACHYHQIQPASTSEAIESCPDSLIGRGSFSAHVVLPEQSPFPAQGTVLAFNGIFHGEHAIFAHVYGTEPIPQSNVLVFKLGKASGRFHTTLTAELPQVAAEWGYVSNVSLSLKRIFRYKGRERSYVSAGCPAAPGFPGATFAFARATFGFEDGRSLETTMTRSCGAKSSNGAG